jgi:hypothetical protein
MGAFGCVSPFVRVLENYSEDRLQIWGQFLEHLLVFVQFVFYLGGVSLQNAVLLGLLRLLFASPFFPLLIVVVFFVVVGLPPLLHLFEFAIFYPLDH